ncbi:MAG: VWA domain-containing protein [Desulfobacterales bacterium]
MYSDPIKNLSFADPEIAESVKEKIEQKNIALSKGQAQTLYEEVIWALSVEYTFGNTLAVGYISLYETVKPDKVEKYKELVRKAGEKGPTFGRILAEHLVPVLADGDEKLLENFLDAVNSMQQKGTYTLSDPLKAVSLLLSKEDKRSCYIFLEILKYLFSKELTYSESRHFSHLIPKRVLSFQLSKRFWQAEELYRIIREDYHLADLFFDGMEKGLSFLSREALKEFVTLGLQKYTKDKLLGMKFISLESKFGADTLFKLQTSAPLSDIRLQLVRYMKAKTGRFISVCPLSLMPGFVREAVLNENGDRPFVFSDGKFLYLPDEIDLYETYEENIRLYKCLARLESGLYEFNTFGFDLEKAVILCGLFSDEFSFPEGYRNEDDDVREDFSDLEKFFRFFPVWEFARDLFNIFEHGRIRIISAEKYPGLVRFSYPLLIREAKKIYNEEDQDKFLFLLYMLIALGEPALENFNSDDATRKSLMMIYGMFAKAMNIEKNIETCALLVFQTYGIIDKLIRENRPDSNLGNSYRPFKMPFGRRLRPDLYFAVHKKYEREGMRIRSELRKKNIPVFKSDIVSRLVKNDGTLSNEDIKNIVFSFRDFSDSHGIKNNEIPPDLSLSLFSELDGNNDALLYPEDNSGSPVFWYREWDANLCDYLNDHVRVTERKIEVEKSDFYAGTLNRYRGTVKRLRREFELLRPEKIKTLRRWVEGEEFDYRALLDFAIDKKAGLIPSDRLYIKRIKQQRDITALLLIDLSRSTSGLVMEANRSVHEIIKEAAVLFCETLNVAGDKFAVAGFSGTGRFGVDYYIIKDFSENMDDTVRKRINAVSPQRRTRMGAAIRHATRRLEEAHSKVRLLLIISDGFPNDTDYRQVYAIEDTRRAISEAQSGKIYVRAITVDISPDSRLDDLYGHFHHNVISDVRQLPDRLLRIYGTLTRQ